MISSLIAGLTILIFSGFANTYLSCLLIEETELPHDENNL